MTGFSRRASDRITDIDGMIADENDPRQRAFLIILNSINNSLQANTKMTKEVAGKLNDHLTVFALKSEEDAAMLNKGRGAWKVITVVYGLLQVIALASWGAVSMDLKDLHNKMLTVTIKEEQHELRLKSLETP